MTTTRQQIVIIVAALIVAATGIGLAVGLVTHTGRHAAPTSTTSVTPAAPTPKALPSSPPAPPAPTAKPPTLAAQDYVVRPGDTLWSISGHFSHIPGWYPAIANASWVKNPALIFPGQVLHIPEIP